MKARLNLEALEARDTPSTITPQGSTVLTDGSAHNDTDLVMVTVFGGAGHDVLYGQPGNDTALVTVMGGAGTDTVDPIH